MGNLCTNLCNKQSTHIERKEIEATAKGSRTVLLLGEGNFSYALARVRLHLLKHDQDDYSIHMIATSYDTEEELYQKYPETRKIFAKIR